MVIFHGELFNNQRVVVLKKNGNILLCKSTEDAFGSHLPGFTALGWRNLLGWKGFTGRVNLSKLTTKCLGSKETFPFSHRGYPQIIHFRWGFSTNVMVPSWNHIPMMWSTISTISINKTRIFHEINHPASSDKGLAPWHWKASDNGHTTAASYWTNQSGVSVVSSSQWSLMHVYKSCIVAEQVCMSKIFKDSDPNICFRFLPSMEKKTWNLTIMDSWPSPELLSDETHKNQHAEGVEEDLATCRPCTPLKASVYYCGWLRTLAVDRC